MWGHGWCQAQVYLANKCAVVQGERQALWDNVGNEEELMAKMGLWILANLLFGSSLGIRETAYYKSKELLQLQLSTTISTTSNPLKSHLYPLQERIFTFCKKTGRDFIRHSHYFWTRCDLYKSDNLQPNTTGVKQLIKTSSILLFLFFSDTYVGPHNWVIFLTTNHLQPFTTLC